LPSAAEVAGGDSPGVGIWGEEDGIIWTADFGGIGEI
jgi:hypothetical protein